MPVSKEEKYLSSIDSTLKDILKELKRQGRSGSVDVELKIDGKEVAREVREINSREDRLKAYGR